jgi:hypothetical protein
MSLKLSRNKVNFLTKQIVDYIESNDDSDYLVEIGEVRLKTFHIIMDELRKFEQIEEKAKTRIESQKKAVPYGSREWEILFRKFCAEELDKLGKVWD